MWFAESVVSAALVAADMGHTPESPVLKWGFVIVTLYTGPIGLVLYLWSCREPLPGTHEEYVRARWRQVVGSTMHCVAGDGMMTVRPGAKPVPLAGGRRRWCAGISSTDHRRVGRLRDYARTRTPRSMSPSKWVGKQPRHLSSTDEEAELHVAVERVASESRHLRGPEADGRHRFRRLS